MWDGQLALANRGWRVIVPQFRGFDSRAAVTLPAASTDDYAGDVIDLLDALHLKHVVVGGLSMGGYVAFAMLRLAARYVQALILADTKPQADTPEAVAGRLKMLELVQTGGPTAIADEMVPKLLGSLTRDTQPETVDRVRELILANSTEAIAGAIRALIGRPDSTPLLQSIHVPTLILVGQQDVLTPPSVSELMHSAIPGSELQVIADAGHLANLDQPAAFDAALARFLDHRV